MKHIEQISILPKTICTLFLFLIACSSNAQGVSESKPEPVALDYLFSPELIYQSAPFIGLNLGIGHIQDDTNSYIPIIGFIGYRIGVEANLSPENFTIAPKVGLEASFLALSTRLSAVHYFQGGRKELRLLPELGSSLGGWGQLNYGYGLSVFNGNIHDVSRHRINLSFNLNRDLQYAAFELFGL